VITAQVEPWHPTIDEMKPLLPLHWAELALNQDKVPLQPQWHVYDARDARGELVLVTLRELGVLLGYFIGFVAPGLHYETCLTCTMDIFYVHPEHRTKRGGIILFKAVEAELKRRGVDRWFVGSKIHADASPLFERLKFSKVETYYTKWLGD
jgi:GNAT superfamily N-acetyltransferase